MSAALVARRRRLWLAVPTRAAALPRSSARIAIAIVLVQVAAVLLTPMGGDGRIDGSAAAALADAVRGGGGFYDAAADLVRGEALRPTSLDVPMPTLAVALGHVGPLAWPLLVALAAGAIAAGAARLRAGLGLTRAGAATGAALLVVGVLGTMRPSAAVLPEAWAGLLVLLALARSGPGRVAEPAAWALAAAVVAPAAFPVLAALGWRAWRHGGARGAAPFLIAGAVALAALALHARAVAALPASAAAAAPLRRDLAAGMSALVRGSGLGLLPDLPARLIGLAAAVGWAAWGARAARLPLLLLAGYALLAAVAGDRAGLVVAPLLPLGLAALPDAVRDVRVAALARRRITVTRIV